MPLNVKKFGASWFLVSIFIIGAFAQAPTSGDILRERVKKAKGLIAIKSYTAAIYELEGIRRETNDVSVSGVVQVMLMSCYLEQGDYKRAQTLLTELYNAQKANKPNANYYSVAAQVVKGARQQLDRYKGLGLAVSDRNLPIEALNDVNKMRETIESVITQSKTLSDDRKQIPLAMPLLEEAINARSSLARDDYDANRWKQEVADTRESMMNSRSVINAVDDSAAQTNTLATNTNSIALETPEIASIVPINNPAPNLAANNENSAQTETAKTDETPVQIAKTEPLKTPQANRETAPAQNANNTKPATNAPQGPTRSRLVQSTPNIQTTETSAETAVAKDDSPVAVGSLLEYATEKVSPTYPQAARTMRLTGVVRVELVVDENGGISVENTTGPAMLQRSAADAVKKWKFKPFTRDGQPVKAKGFVSFNFNL